MAALRVGELEAFDEEARLGRVVVLDRCLEVLALGRGLAQLSAQPAEKAHACLIAHVSALGYARWTHC